MAVGTEQSLGELRVLNELALALGQASDLETALGQVVKCAVGAVFAEQGSIAMIDENAANAGKTVVRRTVDSVEMSALRPDTAIFNRVLAHAKPVRLTSAAILNASPLPQAPGHHAVLSVPVMIRSIVLGVLSVFRTVNSDAARRDGFSDADERLLMILAAQAAILLETIRLRDERALLSRTLGQYVPRGLIDALATDTRVLQPQHAHATVMFADVRGFTRLAERATPEGLFEFLNDVLGFMIEVVIEHGGVVRQLLGDGLFAVFGTPISRGRDEDSRQATAAALSIVGGMVQGLARSNSGMPRVGIGIHAGDAATGLVGTSAHREFVVTGDVVNTASRLEELNKRFNSQILVSGTVWERLEGPVKNKTVGLGQHLLRGRTETIEVFQLA